MNTYKIVDDRGCFNWVRERDEAGRLIAETLTRNWLANAPHMIAGQLRIVVCDETGKPL